MRKENDLPSSIEAEKAVLGSIILEPTLWDSLSVEVDESDFTANEHKYKPIVNNNDAAIQVILGP